MSHRKPNEYDRIIEANCWDMARSLRKLFKVENESDMLGELFVFKGKISYTCECIKINLVNIMCAISISFSPTMARPHQRTA
jgi:hypothetical protein